jgi:hypothetical protein
VPMVARLTAEPTRPPRTPRLRIPRPALPLYRMRLLRLEIKDLSIRDLKFVDFTEPPPKAVLFLRWGFRELKIQMDSQSARRGQT